ncbi:hypothetical protein [Sinisalibacter lacisalsi]|uniref:Uncharacterized protein n=1 Tax=Sinisalibacter lacisalsi TaxID=1526570 RepID=A0ABQ1QV88_9RHOB|nr:hypothetical protein [Sinisalibacter lacisalsi]GGD44657.1 hypothetical protein GCM10011358_30520 [Sinisalibacter lacisalsi]
MTPWSELTPEKQLQLRMDYQTHLDSLPPTCSLDDKVSAFAEWLASRDVAFSIEDVSPKRSRK